ncbi:MAG: hypothetical protein JXA92_06440 [candidate division Zixibacteria bacterium]|nr:hypothetical protein [candidate division Zixibacteria bacterium]
MQWVCNVCGYIHDDDEPPDYCYDCGAPGSNFTEWSDDDEDIVSGTLDDEFDDIDLDEDDSADDGKEDDNEGDIKLDDYN